MSISALQASSVCSKEHYVNVESQTNQVNSTTLGQYGTAITRHINADTFGAGKSNLSSQRMLQGFDEMNRPSCDCLVMITSKGNQ